MIEVDQVLLASVVGPSMSACAVAARAAFEMVDRSEMLRTALRRLERKEREKYRSGFFGNQIAYRGTRCDRSQAAVLTATITVSGDRSNVVISEESRSAK
jgi:hypothetical protein